jgi:S1-C subfamily serine protease
MHRWWALATLFFLVPHAGSSQEFSVLHIKIVLVDAQHKETPVARHALLISVNPTSATPRRVVTSVEGTVDVRLRPGNYTVESDLAVVFEGKSYQWIQTVDVVPGRDAVLVLTASNAEIEAVSPGSSTEAPENDPSFLLPQWKDSIVALWTAKTRASGFVIDAKGLVATNQRVIGTATSVEVQLTPVVKVAGSVLAADPVRDVAVIWIDPKVAASIRPVPVECPQAAGTSMAEGQELWTIGSPLRGQKRMTSGSVRRVDAQSIESDISLSFGSAGGPVFASGGSVVGITTIGDEDESAQRDARIVRIESACDVIASAEKKMKEGAPPNGTHLPVEPAQPFPLDALKEAGQRRAGGLSPYQVQSADFDVGFITPIQTYAAQYQSEQARQRDRGSTNTPADAVMRALMDFGTWTAYVDDFPPVLLVRVTPRLVEGFWTTVARGAARTQGVSLPPIKRFKSGFSRMRVFCGDAEVTPIHPFRLEQRVSESDAINEGLYVFDPGALGPHCGTVKLVLYSEKEPGKGDTRVLDPKVIEQIWQDFTPFRLQTK